MEKWNITSRYHCWPVVAVALMCPLSTLLEHICHWSLKKKKKKTHNFYGTLAASVHDVQKYQHKEIYCQRNIIPGQQNTSGPFIQSKLLTKKKKLTPATSLVGQIPFCLQNCFNCHYSSSSAAATNMRRLGVCPRVYVSFVLWWGQEQCSLPQLLS